MELRTQPLAAADDLERRLRDLERLGFESAVLETVRAGLLAKRGLLSKAAETYRRALATAPSAEVQITLADLNFAMGLHFLAERGYREALAEAGRAGRAAATFGLGRVAYSRGNYGESAVCFRQARELYSTLRLEEEREAARRAESRAMVKAKNQVP
ncbi:MAG TPA: hypothetical protein VGS22_21450 [Thermoanaerobaculia bacterium]|nr:hypothetical protein [Thermoanaerobaculia bacterium]